MCRLEVSGKIPLATRTFNVVSSEGGHRLVIWVMGLSGAGKTTFSEQVVIEARRRGKSVVWLDGDEIRNLFDNDLSHSLEDRRINNQRLIRICSLLDSQGIDVVCSAQSLFPDLREFCRRNFSSYRDVLIDAPLNQLVERDTKGIYGSFQRGETHDVAGMDLEVPHTSPDYLIPNAGTLESLLCRVDEVVEFLFADE